MKRVFRILPLAMALGAISALATAPSGGRGAMRHANTDFSAPSRALRATPALVRFSLASIAATALPAALWLTCSVPNARQVAALHITGRAPHFTTCPLLGAATPRAPAA